MMPQTPTSVSELGAATFFIRGNSEARITLAAILLARRLDPNFRWMDIQIPGDTREPSWSVLRELLGTGQLLPVTNPNAFRPQSGRTLAAAREMLVGADRDDPALRDYLLLPDVLQDFIAEAFDSATPRTLVVTNLDRLSEYLRGREGNVEKYLAALRRFGITVIATYRGDPTPLERFFDYSLLAGRAEVREGVPVLAVCFEGPGAACTSGPCPVRDYFHSGSVVCHRLSSPPNAVALQQVIRTSAST